MEIRLNVFDFDNRGSRKEYYRNVILQDNSLSFDFDSVVNTFRLLYPGKMISFTITL